MAQPQVGSQFAGYRIESLVGRGGMGVVYRATQLDLGRIVALKLIAPDALDDAAARARFVSEARHAAAIEHPNVVPIHAAGEADGVAYFAMRFVDGDDLRTRVRRDGPLAPAEAARIAEGIGAALDTIHAAGLVHRDVKPANILLGRDDHPYLTDFGLARATLGQRGTSTGSGRWAGSLHYAAPEQIRGGRVDARADVYALGGVLFFMLTGHAPFERDSDEATLWAHMAERPPRAGALHPGVPKRLDDVIAQAMAKLPDDRYDSAGDLGRAVAAAAQGGRAPRGRGPVARGAASPSGALALPGLIDEAPTMTTVAPRARAAPPHRLWALGGGLVVAVAAMAVVLAVRPGGSATPRSRPTAAPTAIAAAKPTAAPTAGTARTYPRVARTFRRVNRLPNALALAGGRLWVTSSGRSLVRVDALTGGRRTRDARLGGGTAISVRAGRVWEVSFHHRREIAVAAAPPYKLLAEALGPGLPVAVAAERDGGAWVAESGPSRAGAGSAVHYDAAGRVVASVPVPYGVTGLALGPRAVWVAEYGQPLVLRIDRRTLQPRVASELTSPAGALAYGGGHVWATLPDDDAVARLHGRTPDYQTVGHRPERLVYARGQVFVTSRFDGTLVAVDARTLRIRHTLTVPLDPFAVAAGGGHVWVSSFGKGSVTRVDLGPPASS
jgi:Protein kinase domain